MTRNDHPLSRFDLNYKQLAKKSRVSYGYLRQIAAGIRTPSFNVVERLARACTNDRDERETLSVAIMHFGKRAS